MAELILTTNDNTNKLIQICVDNMIEWGYDVPATVKFMIVDPRRFLGQCRYAKNGNPCTIKLNKSVVTYGTDRDIQQVIYHELIHAVLPKGTHHGWRWVQVAQSVNEKTGLNIARTENIDKFGTDYVMSYKYVFRCKKCGKLIGVSRMTKFVQDYNKRDSNGGLVWWHSTDKGEFERIK